MTALPTGSEVERVMLCLPSAQLPQVRSANEFSRSGDTNHDYLHALRRAGRAVALAEAPEEDRPALEKIDVARLPQVGEAEVTLAWDWTTRKGRVLGKSLKRDYSAAKPTEYVCTTDVFNAGAVKVNVDDYKTGYMWVEPDTWQQKLGAVAGAAAAGVDAAESTIYRIRDGEVTPISVSWDGFDLDMFGDELVALAKRLEADRPEGPITVTEGEHCRYCPAIRSCPAKREALSSVAGLEKYRDAEMVPVAELGKAWTWLQSVKKMLPIVEANLKKLAAHTAIPIGDKALQEKVVREESISAPLGLVVLSAQWPEAAKRIGFKLTEAEKLDGKITKEAIKSEWPKKVDRDAVWAALQAGGAIVVTEVFKVKVA